jgi:adenine C2-methylase RlmN of 23S rRNA A2503 and tRNA A37
MESIIPLILHPLILYGVQSAKQYCVTMRNEESMRDETYKYVMLRKGVNISEVHMRKLLPLTVQMCHTMLLIKLTWVFC